MAAVLAAGCWKYENGLDSCTGRAKVAFPLDSFEVREYRQRLAQQVQTIRTIESHAVEAMQAALI